MGRSINTGNLTIVLYEDPPDAIPKIHVRSKKYMAWIAENNLPVHMHVEKVRENVIIVHWTLDRILEDKYFAL